MVLKQRLTRRTLWMMALAAAAPGLWPVATRAVSGGLGAVKPFPIYAWQPISALSVAAKRLKLSPVVKRAEPTATYKRTFRFFLAHPEITDRYDDAIRSWAVARSLDARLVKAIVAAESQFSPLALSPTGARGLMQIMPKTAFVDLSVLPEELYDAESNIEAGTGYLEKLFAASWTIYGLGGLPFDQAPHALRQRIIAAYYAGPKNLSRRHRFGTGTRAYVRKVLLYYHSSVTDFRRPPEAMILSSKPRPHLPWSKLAALF